MSNTIQISAATSLLIATLALPAPDMARAQGIPAQAAVETIVADLSQEIQSIIAQLEYSADVTSFKIRSDLLLLLEHLEYSADKLTDKTFSELSSIERQFFNHVRQTLDEADDLLETNLNQIDKLIAGLGVEMSRLPFVEETPMVQAFEPAIHVLDGSRLVVSASGSRLGHEDPELSIAGRPCELISKTELRVAFSCEIESNSGDRFLVAKGRFFEEREWWRLFGAKSREYVHEVRLLPPVIAKYELSYFYETEDMVEKSRSQSNSHKNPHCVGARGVNWRYNVSAPACKIDPDSIKVNVDWKSSRSHYNGVQNASSSGFNVTGSAQNNGSCGPKVFGGRAGKDGRGGFGVTASWTEHCQETQEIAAEIQTGCLLWNRDVHIPTPGGKVKRWALKVELLDGTQRVVSQPSDFDALAVVRPNDGAVLIRPNSDLALEWNAAFIAGCQGAPSESASLQAAR